MLKRSSEKVFSTFDHLLKPAEREPSARSLTGLTARKKGSLNQKYVQYAWEGPLENALKDTKNLSKKGPEMVKISLDARLGDGLGAKMTQEGHQELQKYKNIEFLGLPGSPTWSKNREKNYSIFLHFSGTIGKLLFLVLGTILRGKTSPKSEVPGSLFRLRSENAKSIFLNDPPSFLLYFSSWRHRFSASKSIFFVDFFKAAS